LKGALGIPDGCQTRDTHAASESAPLCDGSSGGAGSLLCLWSDQFFVDAAGYLISHATKNS